MKNMFFLACLFVAILLLLVINEMANPKPPWKPDPPKMIYTIRDTQGNIIATVYNVPYDPREVKK